MKLPKISLTQQQFFNYLMISFAVMALCTLANLVYLFKVMTVFSVISSAVQVFMYCVLFAFFYSSLQTMKQAAQMPPDTLKDSSADELQKAAEEM